MRGEFYQPFQNAHLYSFLMLPFGAIVATCELTDVVPTDELRGKITEREEFLGDYSPGRFAWCLSNIKPLATPHFVTGRQGFFEVNLPPRFPNQEFE